LLRHCCWCGRMTPALLYLRTLRRYTNPILLLLLMTNKRLCVCYVTFTYGVKATKWDVINGCRGDDNSAEERKWNRTRRSSGRVWDRVQIHGEHSRGSPPDHRWIKHLYRWAGKPHGKIAAATVRRLCLDCCNLILLRLLLLLCFVSLAVSTLAVGNVTVWCPSVCLFHRRILDVTNQGTARDAASVHFCPSITRTGILVLVVFLFILFLCLTVYVPWKNRSVP